jgi:hypothetical protein
MRSAFSIPAKALAAAAAVLTATSLASAAAPAPAAGTYAANVIVDRVAGARCLDQVGAVFAGVVNYPGFGGANLTIRLPLTDDIPEFYAAISRQELTISGGARTLTPSGRFTWTIVGGPIAVNGLPGTFEAILAFVDQDSFTMTVTETEPSLDCTEQFKVALVRIGA